MQGATAGLSLPATRVKRMAIVALVVSVTFGALLGVLAMEGAIAVIATVIALVGGATLALKLLPRLGSAIGIALQEERFTTAVLIAAALLMYPLFMAPYWVHVATMIFIYAILVSGLNIHLGEVGAINVGYAGIFAIGAYTAALLAVAGWPFWLNTAAAVVACYLAGVLLGACTLRTKGDYLVLVTLGFGLIINQLIINLTWLTHGPDGVRNIPVPTFFGHGMRQPIELGGLTVNYEANFYYLALALLGLVLLVVWRAKTSWIGRTWNALRQDSLALSCFGVNVPVVRVKSFALGSSFAGLAGALFAQKIGFVGPEDFTLFLSMMLISMVILGGMGNMLGVLAGCAIWILIPEKFREFQDYRFLIYGLTLILLLIYRPHGLFPSASRRYD